MIIKNLLEMAKARTQLNINIDPELLLLLKSEAIKSGKTLTDYVIGQLKNVPKNTLDNSLENRLLKIEKFLGLDGHTSKQETKVGCIFTDEGAKVYGEIAKQEFESHMKKMELTREDALAELAIHLKNYPYSNPELVFQILLGTHVLTGIEMTLAYRTGSCAMRSALNDWTKDPLENLNEAFLNAVVVKNLAKANDLP